MLLFGKMIMELNARVLIEPRGFIRVIQLVMSIFAFATTAGFETESKIDVRCPYFARVLHYKFGYPFRLGKSELRVPKSCNISDDKNNSAFTTAVSVEKFETYTFPFDFSSNAEFFVAAGALTLIYTTAIIVVYVFMNRMYSTNPMTPIVDFMATGVVTIFWFAGACAWAQGVSDVKYYTNPNTLMPDIDICVKEKVCYAVTAGNFASLNVSLIFGFANCMLWASSLWFVYKETSFHQPPQPPAMLPEMGQQQAPPMQDQDLDLGHKIGGGQYEY